MAEVSRWVAGALRAWPRPLKLAFVATLLAAAQIAYVLHTARAQGFDARSSDLLKWDSSIFLSITNHGYLNREPLQAPGRSWETNNVAYPPVLPALASVLHRVLRVPTEKALLLAAWVGCAIFWFYLLSLCRLFGLRPLPSFLGALLVLFFPGSVFLSAAYSDAMMHGLGLGYLYWTHKRNWRLAALHGFLMGLTHFRGLFYMPYPFLLAMAEWLGAKERPTLKQMARETLGTVRIAAFPVVGLVTFLGYCQWKFGAWDLYFQTVNAVWGVGPRNFLEPFNLSLYRWTLPLFQNDGVRLGIIPGGGRFFSSLFLALSLLAILKGLQGRLAARRGVETRSVPLLALGLMAFAIQYLLISVHAPHHNLWVLFPMCSLRYLIGPAALLAMGLLCVLEDRRAWRPKETLVLEALLLVIALDLLVIQRGYIFRFFYGTWQG